MIERLYRLFMIRTAVPFGYLFIAFFLLAVFVIGIGILIWAWRRRSQLGGWLGGGIVVWVILAVVCNVTFESGIEWNPTIRSDSEVLGTWTDRDQTIILAPNKTFSYRTSSQMFSGTWSRDDWNLYLRGNKFSSTMRFIQFLGHYRLMTHPPQDPDMWDGELGLKQTNRE